MTRPEQVFNFLKNSPKLFYCDDCIAKALEMPKRHAVQQITAPLALCSDFIRSKEVCHSCKTLKLSIKAK
jgi:hypothetical protein